MPKLLSTKTQVDVLSAKLSNTISLDPPSGGDDTAMVQSCLNSADSILIPPFTYLVHGLVPHDGLSVYGASWKALLKQNGNQPVFMAPYTGALYKNLRFEGFSVDGNKAAGYTSGAALYLERVKNVHCEKLYIINCAQPSILLGNPNPGEGGQFTISNCRSINPALAGNFWGGIAVTGGDVIIIDHNICLAFDGPQQYGIDIEPNTKWSARYIRINDNLVRNGTINVRPGPGGIIQDAEVCNNTIMSYPSAGIGAALILESVTGHCVARGNTITAPIHTSPGIGVVNVADVQLESNRIMGLGTDQAAYPNNVGIKLDNVNGGLVQNNYITAPLATHAVRIAGIVESGTTTGVQYSGNKFRNITVQGKAGGVF